MNDYAKIQNYTLTDEECEKNCEQLELYFEKDIYGDACVGCCLELALYRHFGSSIVISKARLERAVCDGLRYFNSDWGWFRQAREGLPFFLLFGNDSQIKGCASKFPIDADPGMTTPLEYEMPLLQLLVCNELVENRQSSEAVEQQIAKSRKKNPIQFLKVFQAAVRGSQSEYENALLAGLKHYQGLSEKYLDATISMYYCKELTAINLMAGGLGKKCPELPPELGACLLTKASVGC